VRFVYLNRNCFNGIYRTNKDGHFNVPFSADRTGAYFTLNELIECSRVLQNAELRAWDFGTTLRYVKEGDFVYLDPPFAVSRRRVFREYGVRPFDIDDVDRLGTHLRKIADRGADFLVSYADSSEARELARPWRWRRVPVRRHIAGFGEARKRAYELMITNIDRELVANEP
jgi:DNA adenine methylase